MDSTTRVIWRISGAYLPLTPLYNNLKEALYVCRAIPAGVYPTTSGQEGHLWWWQCRCHGRGHGGRLGFHVLYPHRQQKEVCCCKRRDGTDCPICQPAAGTVVGVGG